MIYEAYVHIVETYIDEITTAFGTWEGHISLFIYVIFLNIPS